MNQSNMQEIRISPNPNQRFNVTLNGQNCTISLKQMGSYLYLGLAVDSFVICEGAICQEAAEIIQSPSPYFKGSLFFIDTEGSNPPDWSGLGARYRLIFAPARD